jgi:hypothetical protein
MDEQTIATNHPDLYNSLIPLLRTKKGDLGAYLQTVAIGTNIDNTKAKAHCHFISLDGNKRPRVKDFARFLGRRITDFAIPRSEINKALINASKTGSASPMDDLNSKARSLFTRLPKSGEGGELLLSVLAESVLELPQLFTKMKLKTNPEMHVHGSDGVHAGVNKDTGNLILYWGESKLYNDVTSATFECFSSLAPFLLDSGGSTAAQESDLRLMRDGIDLHNADLESALKMYLDPDNPMFNKIEFRGLCLIGFDSEHYPTEPNSKEIEQLKDELENVFNSRKAHIEKRLTEEKIHSFEIEIFCLPFPSVEDFRKAFRKELGLDNE